MQRADLPQRGLHRLAHRRVVEEDIAVAVDVGGRLAVGDHDDLLGAGLLGQQLAAEQEGVLHVGAVDEVPGDLGELLGRELAGHLAEPHDPEVVAGNCAEISECRAMATFLAGRKLSRIGIDSDRSSISTVDDRVTVLGQLDLEVVR